nr:hypothetical protein CFP56_15785 [Quercus suber]
MSTAPTCKTYRSQVSQGWWKHLRDKHVSEETFQGLDFTNHKCSQTTFEVGEQKGEGNYGRKAKESHKRQEYIEKWYHRRSDHHIVDYYALRNIFHEKVARGDLVIKNGKHTNQKMHRPKVAMTFFIGCEDPMEEEAGSATCNSTASAPLVELHYAEVALYQKFILERENKILPFNAIVLERKEEGDGEVAEPERPPKIRRITKPNGKLGRERIVEEPVKEAPECMNDVVENV